MVNLMEVDVEGRRLSSRSDGVVELVAESFAAKVEVGVGGPDELANLIFDEGLSWGPLVVAR